MIRIEANEITLHCKGYNTVELTTTQFAKALAESYPAFVAGVLHEYVMASANVDRFSELQRLVTPETANYFRHLVEGKP